MTRILSIALIGLACIVSTLAQSSASYRATAYSTDIDRLNNEAHALLVDFATNAPPRFHWQTNLYFDVDVTAAGIAALDALAPVVAVTTPRHNMPVEIERVMIVGADKYSFDQKFDLLFCSQPITWPATNAPANLLLSELNTRLGTVIRHTDGNWGAMGATNVVWTSTNALSPRFVVPATNTFFVYAVNVGAMTNTGPFRISFTLRQ